MKHLSLALFILGLLLSNYPNTKASPCNFLTSAINQRATNGTVPSNAHRARENEYDVNFYFLDLDIEKSSTSISGNVMIQAKSLVSSLDSFAVELDNTLTIDSAQASVNGGSFQTATVARSGTEINIILPTAATLNQQAKVRIYYHGAPTASGGFPISGFFSSASGKFSASPPYNSYTWFPCKQVLPDKADSSWFFITTDTSCRGVSNGLLTNVTNIGSNKKRWEWKSNYPIDFYLISFAIGAFNKTTQYFHPIGRTDSMVVEYYNYTPSGNTVLNILQVYSNLFGLYPFYNEKFGFATVNLQGGMENQTLVSIGVGGVEAHETCHQWFGDNVTCGSWNDVMLNEGFARWSESLYPEFQSGTSVPANRIPVCDGYELSVLSHPNSSGYGPADTSSVFGVFGTASVYYDKNAMMINSLRFHINNDSLFFAGLHNYQTQFGGKTALGSDLRDVMQATSGVPLTDFFDQWYYGFGFPTFNVNWNQEHNQVGLKVTESTSSTSTPLFKTPLEITFKRTQGDTTVRIFVSSNLSNFTIPCGGTVTGLAIDTNQWIPNGAGAILQDTSIHIVSSITEIERNDVDYSVYPNPANQIVNIYSTQNTGTEIEAELYNTVGQLVQQHKVEPNGQLLLPKVESGIYMLRLNHSKVFRLMIGN